MFESKTFAIVDYINKEIFTFNNSYEKSYFILQTPVYGTIVSFTHHKCLFKNGKLSISVIQKNEATNEYAQFLYFFNVQDRLLSNRRLMKYFTYKIEQPSDEKNIKPKYTQAMLNSNFYIFCSFDLTTGQFERSFRKDINGFIIQANIDVMPVDVAINTSVVFDTMPTTPLILNSFLFNMIIVKPGFAIADGNKINIANNQVTPIEQYINFDGNVVMPKMNIITKNNTDPTTVAKFEPRLKEEHSISKLRLMSHTQYTNGYFLGVDNVSNRIYMSIYYEMEYEESYFLDVDFNISTFFAKCSQENPDQLGIFVLEEEDNFEINLYVYQCNYEPENVDPKNRFICKQLNK